jgi:hypothetical protein
MLVVTMCRFLEGTSYTVVFLALISIFGPLQWVANSTCGKLAKPTQIWMETVPFQKPTSQHSIPSETPQTSKAPRSSMAAMFFTHTIIKRSRVFGGNTCVSFSARMNNGLGARVFAPYFGSKIEDGSPQPVWSAVLLRYSAKLHHPHIKAHISVPLRVCTTEQPDFSTINHTHYSPQTPPQRCSYQYFQSCASSRPSLPSSTPATHIDSVRTGNCACSSCAYVNTSSARGLKW